MASIRQERIASVLKKELGIVFQEEQRTIFGGLFISVTLTRPSPDLGSCKVYVSILDKVDKAAVIKELNQRSGLIRGKLGNKVGKQLRHVPDLRFYLDDSIDYAEQIDQLLQ